MENDLEGIEPVVLSLDQLVIEGGILLEVVGEAESPEILPLLPFSQVVYDDNVLVSPLIQFVDDGAADQPSAAGHQNPTLPIHIPILRISFMTNSLVGLLGRGCRAGRDGGAPAVSYGRGSRSAS